MKDSGTQVPPWATRPRFVKAPSREVRAVIGISADRHWPVAQRTEHSPYKGEVAGSAPAGPTKVHMKKIKVRIAVAVASDGSWSATGASNLTDTEAMYLSWEGVEGPGPEAEYFVTAELDVPEAQEVEGKVG